MKKQDDDNSFNSTFLALATANRYELKFKGWTYENVIVSSVYFRTVVTNLVSLYRQSNLVSLNIIIFKRNSGPHKYTGDPPAVRFSSSFEANEVNAIEIVWLDLSIYVLPSLFYCDLGIWYIKVIWVASSLCRSPLANQLLVLVIAANGPSPPAT